MREADYRKIKPVKRSRLCRQLFLMIILCPVYCQPQQSDKKVQALISLEYLHEHNNNATARLIDSGVKEFLLEDRNHHNHTFQLTDEQIGLLELGLPTVHVSSINQGHSHNVTLQFFE